jgi:hypothetical protein
MVPAIEKEYELWIPANKRIYNAIYYIVKAINEFTNGSYNPKKIPALYNKNTSEPYDINLTIKESTIRNGTELILI